MLREKKHKKIYFSNHVQLKWTAYYQSYSDQVIVVCKAVIFLIYSTWQILKFGSVTRTWDL